MYGRSSKSAFVCLRCQLRLAQKSQRSQWLKSSDQGKSQTQRRWQSAAAVAEDSQDYVDAIEPPRSVPQKIFKYKGEKVWKPERTAQLGVSSLGKPAEVLLLHERDRPIPRAPAEPRDAREGDVLPAAWSTENSLLSPEQVTKNIEQIREQASKDLNGDQDVQRKQVRKKLQMGFSARQLQNYIEQNQGEATKPWRKRPYNKNFQYSVKAQMAWHIFKNIWGIQAPETTETMEVVEAETSKDIQMPPDVLEALLQTDNTTLRQISVSHNVQIDFFRSSVRKPAQIIISGTSKAVEAAGDALQKLRGNVRKQSIVIGDRRKVKYEVEEASLLAEIRQRYGVHIKVAKLGVNIYYHVDRPPDADAIRRHLLLAQREDLQPSHMEIWPKIQRESLLEVDVGLSTSGSFDAPGRGNMRLIASEEDAPTTAIPQMSNAQKTSFTKVYSSTREAIIFNNQKLKKLAAAQPGSRIETRALFGLAVIRDRDGGGDELSMTAPKPTAPLTTKILLLAQFLAKRKAWKEENKQTSGSADSVEKSEQGSADQVHPLKQPLDFNYQLVLSPGHSHLSSPFPRLKIQLAGADAVLGLNQQLQIKRISVPLAVKASYLLLPSRAVDVKFQSQMIRDIYREGVQPEKRHEKLLTQLAEYFNQTGALPESKFAPFVNLNVPTDLKTKPYSKSQDDDVAEEHEYILESAEALDVASYRLPFMSKLCLEHVVFIGDGKGDGRQVLQLAEQSIISPLSTQKTSFSSFFNSAYEIARLLGDPALLRKS